MNVQVPGQVDFPGTPDGYRRILVRCRSHIAFDSSKIRLVYWPNYIYGLFGFSDSTIFQMEALVINTSSFFLSVKKLSCLF